MSTINDLPPGNGYVHQWAQYHPSCPCATCQQLRAFSGDGNIYKLRESGQRIREMTAADLGLPLALWSVEWLGSMYGKRQRLDAPYAFWLGAKR